MREWSRSEWKNVSKPTNIPSVDAIRTALEEIPGAMREDPSPEDAGVGGESAIARVLSDPGCYLDAPTLRDFADDDDSDVAASDGPEVVFEVPPDVTDADLRQALGDELLGELQRLQQIRGVDALGWYVTFHQRKFQHGVHIPTEGVVLLAWQALSGLNFPVERKLQVAFHAILRHELFHFAADCMTANWELVSGTQVFWKTQSLRNAAGHLEHEEGLANAYMLRGFKHPSRLLANAPGAYRSLKAFCDKQPAGYDDGPEFAKSRDIYLRKCRDLSGTYHLVSSAVWKAPPAFDKLTLYPDVVRIDWTRCPIIVHDQFGVLRTLGIGVSNFSVIPDIEETEKFTRTLRRLDSRIQHDWNKRKLILARSTGLSSLDFKQWHKAGDDYYSVRVNGNHRAHLRYDRPQFRWFAEKIGNHKEMGHG